VEWGVAAEALRGESQSGDAHVVCAVPNGTVLAVVDGIGHGREAADAARRAAAVIERSAARGAVAIVRLCHEALIGTRGVVMSVAMIDCQEDTVTWLGVGNVAGLLARGAWRSQPPQEEMFVRAGVVGMQLPLLQASVSAITPGDVLVMATDGVRLDFAGGVAPRLSPSRLADRLLAEHARSTDDALVLVARYLGRGTSTTTEGA
jgi:serine phosphatase RsbU (regulator of sigma subunit)